MRRHELAIEQFRPGQAQRCHQVGQCDFRRIGRAGKHAFAAENLIEPHAIKAPGELPISLFSLPHLDRVSMAEPVQVFIAPLDAVADPAAAFVLALRRRCGLPRRRAGIHDVREGGVAGDGESSAPQGSRQRVGQVETIQRKDCPQTRFDPEDLGILAAVRHGEDAAAIGEHQKFRFDHRRGAGRVHDSAVKS